MKTELKELILKRISTDNLRAFSCYDFTDLASYKTISKCIERMEDLKEVVRIVNGVYCLNQFDEVLSLPILPSINDVAECLARKHNWIICPTGNLALNIMGLSNQVPATYIYLSSGPYKQYKIYDITLTFKRTMNRELGNYSYKTLLIIQCIKTLGVNNISEKDLNTLSNRLSTSEKNIIIEETPFIQTWIRNIIMKICKE